MNHWLFSNLSNCQTFALCSSQIYSLTIAFAQILVINLLVRILSACLTTIIDLLPKSLGLWPPFFPREKFISVLFLNFVAFTFVSCKSAFLCILINTMECQLLCMRFNGRHIAFIMCITGPGKISLICKIHFIDRNHSYASYLPVHTDKAAIDDQICFSRQQIPGPVKCIPATIKLKIMVGKTLANQSFQDFGKENFSNSSCLAHVNSGKL